MAVIKDIEELSLDIKAAAVPTYWQTYKFGYLGEVNSSHNTEYPLMLLLPPVSQFPDPYKNDEELRLEFHLFRQVEVEIDEMGNIVQMQNATSMLERTFDNLLERFRGTMETLLKNQEHKYINAGAWDIERISSAHNDDLVGLEVTIRLRKYTHCLLTNP